MVYKVSETAEKKADTADEGGSEAEGDEPIDNVKQAFDELKDTEKTSPEDEEEIKAATEQKEKHKGTREDDG